jgi:hypothetical protein
MIEIIRNPATTDNGNICKFSAAYNPMYFEVSRKDFTITGSASNAGFLQLFIADTTGLTVNQQVYIVCKDAGNAIIKSGTFTIFEVNPTNLTLLTSALSPTNAVASGWLNTLSNTKREIEITGGVIYNGLNISYFTARRFSYDSTGTVKVYVNSILNDLFAKVFDVQASGIALVNSACLELKAQVEDIESGDTAEINEYYGVKAVRQLPDDNRLIEYEVYYYGTTVSDAKFLTAFAKPVMFVGYPFHLYCLRGRTDDTICLRQTAAGGIALDTPFPNNYKGVFSMRLSQQSTERSMTAQIIADAVDNQSFLLIDADSKLQIDNTGNNFLRID